MKTLILLLFVHLFYFIPSYSYAHEWWIDSFGGHHCLTDCWKHWMATDQYHYHPNNSDKTSSIIYFCPSNFDQEAYLEKKNYLDNLWNDKRITDLNLELNTKLNKLNKFDIEWLTGVKDLENKLWNQWYTPAFISSKLASYKADRALDRMWLVSQYNEILWNLQAVKDDLKRKREFMLIWYDQETAFYITCEFERDNNIWAYAIDSKQEDLEPVIVKPVVVEKTQQEKEFETLKERYIATFSSKLENKLKQISQTKLDKVIIKIDDLLETNLEVKTRAKLEALREVIKKYWY